MIDIQLAVIYDNAVKAGIVRCQEEYIYSIIQERKGWMM
jgi:RNase P/RNase MRP subunit POP5